MNFLASKTVIRSVLEVPRSFWKWFFRSTHLVFKPKGPIFTMSSERMARPPRSGRMSPLGGGHSDANR